MKLTSKDFRYLATHPQALARLKATGRYESPFEVRESPLLQLLRQINDRDLLRIREVSLGPALGYRPRPLFRDASALKCWLEDPQSGPGPGAALSHFRGPVYLDDLIAAAEVSPELGQMRPHYPRLVRPTLPTRDNSIRPLPSA